MLSDHRPTTPKDSIDSVTRIVERSPAKTKVTQAAIATTPSQPISGTGRGKAGMLISSWKNSDDRVERVADAAEDAAEEPVVLRPRAAPSRGPR